MCQQELPEPGQGRITLVQGQPHCWNCYTRAAARVAQERQVTCPSCRIQFDSTASHYAPYCQPCGFVRDVARVPTPNLRGSPSSSSVGVAVASCGTGSFGLSVTRRLQERFQTEEPRPRQRSVSVTPREISGCHVCPAKREGVDTERDHCTLANRSIPWEVKPLEAAEWCPLRQAPVLLRLREPNQPSEPVPVTIWEHLVEDA